MSNPYDSNKLRAHQLEILSGLKVLSNICEQHNLRYFLVGGTALGAIRHKGFIPWDDDIDVGLPRPDYERLESILLESDLGKFSFEPADRPSYPRPPFGAISFFWKKDGERIFAPGIDIFPIDGVPESKFLQYFQKLASDVYHVSVFRSKPRNRGWLSKLFVGSALFLLPSSLLDYLGRVCKKFTTRWNYDSAKLVANVFGMAGYFKEIMPRRYFKEIKEVTFEGLSFPVPHDYSEYLNHLYGDFTKMPPEEKRKPSHGCFF